MKDRPPNVSLLSDLVTAAILALVIVIIAKFVVIPAATGLLWLAREIL